MCAVLYWFMLVWMASCCFALRVLLCVFALIWIALHCCALRCIASHCFGFLCIAACCVALLRADLHWFVLCVFDCGVDAVVVREASRVRCLGGPHGDGYTFTHHLQSVNDCGA